MSCIMISDITVQNAEEFEQYRTRALPPLPSMAGGIWRGTARYVSLKESGRRARSWWWNFRALNRLKPGIARQNMPSRSSSAIARLRATSSSWTAMWVRSGG